MAGGWNVAAVAKNAFDLEGKVVGTLGAGRIGFRVLQRLKPFNCAKLTYYDYAPLPQHAAEEVGAQKVDDLKQFLSEVGELPKHASFQHSPEGSMADSCVLASDVLTINAPLHEGTKHLIDKEKLSWMKKGAWIVNTAR